MNFVQGTLLGGSASAGSVNTLPILSGIVDPAATGPMWAGTAIQEFLAPSSGPPSAGRSLKCATSTAAITGFTVESSALTIALGAKVPMAWPAGSATSQGGPSINFVRLGAHVQLVVRAEPNLVKSLKRKSINVPVGWDFENQRLIAASAGNQLPVSVTDKTLEGVVIVTDDKGRVVWESPSAAAVILL
jgi:hypothetical protein